MNRALIFTFILGAISGGIITVVWTSVSPNVISEPEKISAQNQGPQERREFLMGEVLDIPDDSPRAHENKNHESEESVSYDMIDDSERVPSQLENFERRLASEPEEMPTSVPEEAPPENPE